ASPEHRVAHSVGSSRAASRARGACPTRSDRRGSPPAAVGGVDLGSVAIIALIAGIVGGAVGAGVVGTVEGMLRQRQVARGSITYGGRWTASMRSYTSTHRFTGDAPVSSLNDLAKRETSLDHLDTDSRKV